MSLRAMYYNGGFIVRRLDTPWMCSQIYVFKQLVNTSFLLPGRAWVRSISVLVNAVWCTASVHLKILKYCSNGQLDVVRYLVTEADCNPNVKDKGGETPLHKACR